MMKSSHYDAEEFARAIYQAELAPNTRKAYRKGVESFTAYYAVSHGSDTNPLDADEHAVAAWLLWLVQQPNAKGETIAISTIRLYRAGLGKFFEMAARQSPCGHPLVKATMRGLARERRAAPRVAMPLREHHIADMAAACPPTNLGKRDAAIVTLGFAAALRRSELVALQVRDVMFLDDDSRMMVHIARSKTDQSGIGYDVPVPEGKFVRPVSRLRAWLEASELTDGALFRAIGRHGAVKETAIDGGRVSLIVKRLAGKIGLDAHAVSAHSLRAGFITSAGVHRARMDKIMEVSRHRTPGMVLHYTRDADKFEAHAGEGFL